MVKIDSTGKGGYNPFDAISNSLSALNENPSKSVTHQPVERDKAGDEQSTISAPLAKPDQAKAIPVSESTASQFERRSRPQKSSTVKSEGEPVVQPRGAVGAITTVKRFKTTYDESVRIEQAVLHLGARLGVRVGLSKLTRALWEVYLKHEEDILRNIQGDENVQRASNNDPVSMAEFEEQLVEIVNNGLMVASRRPWNHR